MDYRKKMREKRRALTAEVRLAEAKLLCENFLKLPKLSTYTHIAAYLPFDGEIETSFIIQWLWENHKTVYLPTLCAEKSLMFSVYTSESVLKPNRFNILEPHDAAEISAEHLDLLLMPLVAFDEQCHRLGMGRGFYDAALRNVKKRPLLVGLAYDFQCGENIIPHPGDVSLDVVLTPRQFYSI